MLNVAATLQQRCGNFLLTSESDVVTTSETDVATNLIFDCANVAMPAGLKCPISETNLTF